MTTRPPCVVGFAHSGTGCVPFSGRNDATLFQTECPIAVASCLSERRACTRDVGLRRDERGAGRVHTLKRTGKVRLGLTDRELERSRIDREQRRAGLDDRVVGNVHVCHLTLYARRNRDDGGRDDSLV